MQPTQWTKPDQPPSKDRLTVAGPSAVGPGVSNCTALFRVNATGVQCHDLRQTLAETPAECAGACCADSGCDTWQWSTSVLAGCCWLVFAPPLLVPVLLLLRRRLRLLLLCCGAAAAAVLCAPVWMRLQTDSA